MTASAKIPAVYLLAATAVLLAGCTTFNNRVEESQTAIEDSFKKLGYIPRDSIEFQSMPRKMRGRTWMERQVRFRDHCDRDWISLTKFFDREAGFKFEHTRTCGESESDIQKIRWYEFKIDQVYTVYRVEFVRGVTGVPRDNALPIKESVVPQQPGKGTDAAPIAPRSP